MLPHVRHRTGWIVLLTSLFCAVATTAASEPIAPLSERFATSETAAVPDFQKHVVPLLGRLGCNGRACHGSFQGRGGFQLSLFGYDFAADHQALLEAASGRVDLVDIDESLILAKPTDADAHEGGQRFEPGSWQHHALRRWIEGGAQFDPQQVQLLKRLEVSPSEIQFSDAGETVTLEVIAHWEDGSAEDVTELCRFHSNDDSIAAIDETGVVESAARGDTHVVVSYDNGVVPIPVIRPYSPRNERTQESISHPIDRLVQTKLDKLGIAPSPPCSDADFLRRASFDIAGTLPSSTQVREFLADNSPGKRATLVDELLDSPGYAAWWATRFSDWTGNNAEQLINVLPVRDRAGRLWYEWLRKRIADNMPYDDIVEGIVTAHSRQRDETYLEYCEAMTEACKPGNEALFAERDGLPMYWGRRDFQKPEERAIGFAYTFLGVRIECAQCHKHPFDRWSKQDFAAFAKLFTPILANRNSVLPEARDDRKMLLVSVTDGKKLKGGKLRRFISTAAKQGQTVPFGELLINTRAITSKARREARKRGKQAPMRIPSGRILGELDKVSLDGDTRVPLMQWLRSPENPYFAKAIVNRVWRNYFGIGIVEPVDDLNLANPPSNAALLNHLADDFVAHGYDLKWLHRYIVTSETYQRSVDINESNKFDTKNFARHMPRRLPAEVAYDAVSLATGNDDWAHAMRAKLSELAIADSKPRRRNRNDFALTVFGQSIRQSNCDCDRSDSPSLLQSVYLRNDHEVHARVSAADGWVSQTCRALGVDPPAATEHGADRAMRRRAETAHQKFQARLKKFAQLTPQQQARQRGAIGRQHRQLRERLQRLGYEVPPLEKLIAGDAAWKQLQPYNAPTTQATRWTIEDVIEAAYLRTLSRYPDATEKKIAAEFIEQSETTASGIEGLMWALINTKEFIVTH